MFFNSILLATDFSESSKTALDYILSHFAKKKPEIILCHILDFDESKQDHQVSIENDLLDLAARCERSGNVGNVSTHLVPRHGKKISVAILDLANETGAELITLGAGSSRGLLKNFFGSTATDVLHSAEQPVMVVPKDVIADGALDHILFAVNFQKIPYLLIHSLKDYTTEYGSKAVCLDVNTSHNPLMYVLKEELQDKFGSGKIRFEVIESNDVVEGLLEYTDKHRMDLIITQTHKTGMIERFLTQSYSDKLIKLGHVPVLAYKES